jgi:putative flippase GtrA
MMRWLRFNLVGAMGMCVQLSVLAVLNHAWPGHYLAASAIAVEAAIVHNFVWHVRFTWRERARSGWVWPLARFQMANGAVSLAGNLVLMRLLVQGARVPVVAANVVAIAVCSVVNFWLGDMWAFAG